MGRDAAHARFADFVVLLLLLLDLLFWLRLPSLLALVSRIWKGQALVSWRWRAEDGVEVRKEGGEDGRGHVQGRREDNADVADRHLIHLRVVDDADEECRERADEGPVGQRKAVYENIVGGYLAGFVVELCLKSVQ